MDFSHTKRHTDETDTVETLAAVLTEYEVRTSTREAEELERLARKNSPSTSLADRLLHGERVRMKKFDLCLQEIETIEELDSVLTQLGGLDTDEGEWKPPRWAVLLAEAAAEADTGYQEAFDALPESIQGWLLFKCEQADPLRVKFAEALQADAEPDESTLPEAIRESADEPRWLAFRPHQPRYA